MRSRSLRCAGLLVVTLLVLREMKKVEKSEGVELGLKGGGGRKVTVGRWVLYRRDQTLDRQPHGNVPVRPEVFERSMEEHRPLLIFITLKDSNSFLLDVLETLNIKYVYTYYVSYSHSNLRALILEPN